MHIGKSYNLPEFLRWTRRSIFWLLLIATIPVVLYQVFDMRWLTIPWTIIALLGSATAFIIGFKKFTDIQPYLGGQADMGSNDEFQLVMGLDLP